MLKRYPTKAENPIAIVPYMILLLKITILAIGLKF